MIRVNLDILKNKSVIDNFNIYLNIWYYLMLKNQRKMKEI